MSSTVLTVAVLAALGQSPYGYGPAPYGASAPPYGTDAMPNGPGPATGGPNGMSATGGQYGVEQLYPLDAYENWTRGHFQEMPAYGGYHMFRPYNYKHVLSQSQIAGGWGMSPTMPYSHEYFRRLQQQGSYEPRGPAFRPPYTGDSRQAASRDFQQANAEVVRETPAAAPGPVPAPGLMPAPGLVSAPVAARSVDANYNARNRQARLDELQEQIRQESVRLQALRDALAEEYERGAAPARGER